MNLTAAKSLLKKLGTGFLATTDGRRPTVRPMSAYAWFGKEFWMASQTDSVKITDLAKKPAVDLCFYDPKTMTHLRLAGRCRLSRALADKKKMFAAFPWMKDFFESPESPGWLVLRVTPKTLRVMTMKTMAYENVKLNK